MNHRRLATWGWVLALRSGLRGNRDGPARTQAAIAGCVADGERAPPHRTRLILKDGSYQIVMSYTVKGNVVSYVSAERGETEQLPNDLVDWDATHKWEREHAGDG